jgi:hypothetical protein
MKEIKIFLRETNAVFGQPSLPAIALARPPSASPQANAGRAQARQAGGLSKRSAWVCG